MKEKKISFSRESSTFNRQIARRASMEQMIRFKNRSICFLEDKKDEALNAFLKNKEIKIISYQELRAMTKLFDVDLDKDRKGEFIGRFRSRRSCKFQNFGDDTSPTLSENSDSLADFSTRNYCFIPKLI